MQYDYGYEYAFPDIMEGAAESLFVGTAGVAAGVLIILYLLLLGYCVVMLVLNAVGMYRIAKRRGIHHAWLSWIPIGNNWLLGSISDHYQYVAKQKVTKRRKILLILSIIQVAVAGIIGGSAAALVISSMGDGSMVGSILLIALLVISYLALIGLAITIMVFGYIAVFDLFRSCRPENDVLFLVLSIFLGSAIFVFVCSGDDKGMPARRAPQQPPVQIPYVQEEVPVAEETPVAEEPAVTETPEEEIPVVEGEIVEDPE